jgi:hypothetical protein
MVVIVSATLFFLSIALLEFLFAVRKWDPTGLREQRWAAANVW